MRMDIDKRVAMDYPDLHLVPVVMEDLTIVRSRPDLQELKADLEAALRDEHAVEALKDEPRVRAYRDFFWSLGIDPTKVRPAAEALVRRVVRGRSLPTINTAVDAYNVASIETKVAFAAFDIDRLHGDLLLRYAREGEEFLGIGMDSPIHLKGRELVIDDGKALVAVYPYRDADASKLTGETSRLLLLGCGVPGLAGRGLREATERAAELIKRYAGK